MKNLSRHVSVFFNLVLRIPVGALLLAAAVSFASGQDTQTNIAIGQTFASPDEAVNALISAATSRDTNALAGIFGSEFKNIKASDPVEGQNELTAFVTAANATNHLTYVTDSRWTLETGNDRWPFPIPIVRTNGVWFFDTAGGEQEILNRRIGYNELLALQSIRAGVEAQREYASADHSGGEVLEFAQKLLSSPGKKDGLYWSPEIDGEISPLGPAFVKARSEGYLKDAPPDSTPEPFHGYFFKILTRQGKHAPGGAYNYVINGHMIGGFAFVAWPADYQSSGVMTFIVNQQGKVYEKDLGPKTAAIAGAMKKYDPDETWEPSPE